MPERAHTRDCALRYAHASPRRCANPHQLVPSPSPSVTGSHLRLSSHRRIHTRGARTLGPALPRPSCSAFPVTPLLQAAPLSLSSILEEAQSLSLRLSDARAAQSHPHPEELAFGRWADETAAELSCNAAMGRKVEALVGRLQWYVGHGTQVGWERCRAGVRRWDGRGRMEAGAAAGGPSAVQPCGGLVLAPLTYAHARLEPQPAAPPLFPLFCIPHLLTSRPWFPCHRCPLTERAKRPHSKPQVSPRLGGSGSGWAQS
jgi:hypothetical protein